MKTSSSFSSVVLSKISANDAFTRIHGLNVAFQKGDVIKVVDAKVVDKKTKDGEDYQVPVLSYELIREGALFPVMEMGVSAFTAICFIPQGGVKVDGKDTDARAWFMSNNELGCKLVDRMTDWAIAYAVATIGEIRVSDAALCEYTNKDNQVKYRRLYKFEAVNEIVASDDTPVFIHKEDADRLSKKAE